MGTRITRMIAAIVAVASFTGMFVSTVQTASAQTFVGSVREASASWSDNPTAPTATARWQAPHDSLEHHFYAVWVAKGAANSGVPTGTYNFLKYTQDLSVTGGPRDLGIEAPATVTFKIKAG